MSVKLVLSPSKYPCTKRSWHRLKKQSLSELCGLGGSRSFEWEQKNPPLSGFQLDSVPKEGFEPSRDCSHHALNVARLPVPPLRLTCGWILSQRRVLSTQVNERAMAVAKSLSTIEHRYKGLTRKARNRRISQKTCVFRSFRGIRVERFWLCYNHNERAR